MSFMRDYAETRAFTLGQPIQPTPLADDRTVLFLRAEPRKPVASLWRFDIESGESHQLLTAGDLEETLSVEERARRERMRLSIGGFTSFTVVGNKVLLPVAGRAVVYDLQTQAKTWVPEGIDPQLSPDGNRVAYVRDFDLFVFDGVSESQVTFGGTADEMNGLAEFVAQEEMQRMHGFWWSPDSLRLAYAKVSQAHVEMFRIADPLHPEREPIAFRYPRAGQANALVRLFIGEDEVHWDRDKFPYLARVTWQDGHPLTFLVQARDQRSQQLRTPTELILEEHDDAWLNIDTAMPKYCSEGMLWTHEREGWWSLVLHGKRTLLGADAKLHQVVKVTNDYVYFLQARTSIDLALARVPLVGGAIEVMTPSAGERSVSFGKSASTYVETVATPSAWRTNVVRGKTLPSVNVVPPLRPNISWKRVGDLDTVTLLPSNYDEAKTYPVVVSVYGGPHHKHVLGSRDSFLREQWIADAGCIVVACDNRGTPRRGRAFERAIVGDFATLALDDQVQALRALATPQMDLSRVGIMGWSFGGYMAALAVLRRPDIFHVAVAGAPVVDWRDYDTHYTERYLGTDLSLYEKSSLLPYAASLKRPLLLVHGTADDNVYFMHSLKLADALFRAGRPFDMLPLPGVTHMVPNAVIAEPLWNRMRDYLTDRLNISRQT